MRGSSSRSDAPRWRWPALVLSAIIILGIGELELRARYRRRVLPPGPSEPDKITLVALGDSIVAGMPGDAANAWPAVLLARLAAAYPGAGWRMVNAGMAGNTTPLGYARFNRDVAAKGPRVVFLAFGPNDSQHCRHALDRWLESRVPVGLERSYVFRALQARIERAARWLGWLAEPMPERVPAAVARTSPGGFVAALSALVDRSRDIGAQVVLLTMPAAAHIESAVQTAQRDGSRYNTRIRALAAQRGVPLVEMADAAPFDAIAPDGIHLTAAGQRWAADRVYETLEAVGLWAQMAQRTR